MNSIRLGRFFGVPIAIHWTFLLVVGFVLISSLGLPPNQGREQVRILGIAALALILHEFGHALAARLSGVKVGGIVLHFFGGVTHLEARSLQGWKELPTALGGPLINLACGLCALAPEGFLFQFGQISLLFGGLNLVPAWPLDGGRILRCLLAIRYPRALASVITFVLGAALCLVLVVIGLFTGRIWLLVLAPFLVITGWRAFLADLSAGAKTFTPDDEPEQVDEGEPTIEEEAPKNPEDLADQLNSFRGPLAEFLKKKRD